MRRRREKSTAVERRDVANKIRRGGREEKELGEWSRNGSSSSSSGSNERGSFESGGLESTLTLRRKGRRREAVSFERQDDEAEGRTRTYGVVPSDESDDDVTSHKNGTWKRKRARKEGQRRTRKEEDETSFRGPTFEVVRLSVLNSPVDDENREEESTGFEEIESERER